MNMLSACYLTKTLVTGLLVHICRKEKIALEIRGKSLVQMGLEELLHTDMQLRAFALNI
jgi:hypothetical protein